ncbi:MAG: hemolysin III family protein [Anaerolineales bacterium]|nr:hemolysin III family protein [Anaerolineales bacterium]
MDKFRDPVSGFTHLGAAFAALAGLTALAVLSRSDLGKLVSLVIYGLSLTLMFSASAAYHLPKANPAAIQALRRMDHAAIYLLIAGTYTPICLYYFNGFWRWGLLAIVWAFAVIGILVKMFVMNAPRWVSAGVYLVMGWLAILGIGEIVKQMPAGAIFWLALGGLLFSAGAVVYITKILNFRPGIFGFHEVWHIFVILGCLCHFILILVYIA